ncbi:hypothetical protein FVR03_19460 [Pontibacter qinzhouensis]|uniref:Uncharacterized protein n=1 Tax=Pontibacter qinzhouensis TaxID=2603253 RepID=A0A5C8J5N9_9BACT|nr:hypothetical protein [Pontibacter qinzhouensis]TXK33225.1 hypothetical protein FVR03_19460 [Pontibacter qinzhouensis]
MFLFVFAPPQAFDFTNYKKRLLPKQYITLFVFTLSPPEVKNAAVKGNISKKSEQNHKLLPLFCWFGK